MVPEGRALEEAQALARTIAQQSGPTLAIGKRAFYAQIEQPLDEAYSVASLAMIDNLAEPDCVEGMSAFLEKRRPTWSETAAGDGGSTTLKANCGRRINATKRQ